MLMITLTVSRNLKKKCRQQDSSQFSQKHTKGTDNAIGGGGGGGSCTKLIRTERKTAPKILRVSALMLSLICKLLIFEFGS